MFEVTQCSTLNVEHKELLEPLSVVSSFWVRSWEQAYFWKELILLCDLCACFCSQVNEALSSNKGEQHNSSLMIEKSVFGSHGTAAAEILGSIKNI